MLDELYEALTEITRDLLVLNHSLGEWYNVAKAVPNSDVATSAAMLCETQANEILAAIQDARRIGR